MNALNEVNKLIAGITYYPNRQGSMDHETEEWLTSERMAVSNIFTFPDSAYISLLDQYSIISIILL